MAGDPHRPAAWLDTTSETGPWVSDAVGGAVTARQLAGLSVAEMTRAMESLADYCADRMIDMLRGGLKRVRGQ